MTAVRLINTKSLPHEEWLAVRTQGIGGSDIAAIAGVSPWKTPLAVYLEKIGELGEAEENAPIYWGNVLEPIVAREYAKRHPDYQVRRVNAVLQHPETPYFLANIDREVRKAGAQPGVLEIKTTSAWMAGRWSEEVPDWVTCQLQWYLGITGYTWGTVAVLIGGNDYREIEQEANQEIIGYLQEIGRRFWEEHVLPRVPPAAEAPDTDTLAHLYQDSNGKEITLPPTALDLVLEYERAVDEIKAAEARRDTAKAKLQVLLGDNERGIVGDRRVDWPTVTQRRIDTKRLQEDHPDLYGEYTKTIRYRRFTVR